MPLSLRAIVAAMAVLLSVGWAEAQEFRPFPQSPIPRLQFRAPTAESVPVATGEETLAARVTVTYSLEGC